MLSMLTCLVCCALNKIPCFSVPQSLLRARDVLAFFGDRDRDVKAAGLEFQNNLDGGNPVFGAINDGAFARGKSFRLGRIGGPFSRGFEIEMRQAILHQDFHEAT